MAERTDTATPEAASKRGFRRHRYLSYQGYAFPWYATLIWLGFFIGAVIYLVRFLLLQ